jgi:hypothetical protein
MDYFPSFIILYFTETVQLFYICVILLDIMVENTIINKEKFDLNITNSIFFTFHTPILSKM